MSFSLGSRLIPHIHLPNFLEQAAQYFKTIEIPTDPRFMTPYFSLNDEQRKLLRIFRERYQFRYTVHAPFVSLGALDPDHRQLALNRLHDVFRLADEIGGKVVTFHPSVVNPATFAQYQEICRYEEESINALLPLAKSFGLVLSIENMPAFSEFHPSCSDGSRLQELLWTFPEREFGITIDIGHALQAGVNPEALLALDRVGHFHCHENDRIADRHLPIMDNLTWWELLIKTLNKKFPHSVGILEMYSWEDQVVSFNHLKNYLK